MSLRPGRRPAHYPTLLGRHISGPGTHPPGELLEWEPIDQKRAVGIHRCDGFHDVWVLEKGKEPAKYGRYPALGHARYHLRNLVEPNPFT